MHELFNFHFLNTISKQLHEALESLTLTPLNTATLATLQTYQTANSAHQGVYLLHYDNQPVYLGKADNVAERLGQHLTKLLGRQHVNPTEICYKCILLDKSMSTAANEKVLIALFTNTHNGMWNGKGFGPKDPGQQRDTTTPSYFDSNYPIRLDINITDIEETETLGSLCQKMKSQLPWVFRYDLEQRASEEIDLQSVTKTPEPLLRAIVNKLGQGWRGAIISFGMVLYKNQKNYHFGTTVDPEH